jgi:Predicted signal transduction protein containing EAL and modified HD-GYP domains
MDTSAHAAAKQTDACLARQPILSKDEKVVGYELLFREGPDDRHTGSDLEIATCSTIDTLNVIGLEVVCDGSLAFINCTHQMLLRDYFMLLPPEKVVVEIQENVVADDVVIGACQRLTQKL